MELKIQELSSIQKEVEDEVVLIGTISKILLIFTLFNLILVSFFILELLFPSSNKL